MAQLPGLWASVSRYGPAPGTLGQRKQIWLSSRDDRETHDLSAEFLKREAGFIHGAERRSRSASCPQAGLPLPLPPRARPHRQRRIAQEPGIDVCQPAAQEDAPRRSLDLAVDAGGAEACGGAQAGQGILRIFCHGTLLGASTGVASLPRFGGASSVGAGGESDPIAVGPTTIRVSPVGITRASFWRLISITRAPTVCGRRASARVLPTNSGGNGTMRSEKSGGSST